MTTLRLSCFLLLQWTALLCSDASRWAFVSATEAVVTSAATEISTTTTTNPFDNFSTLQEYFDQNGYMVLRNYFEKEELDDWKQSVGSAPFFERIFEKLHKNGHTAFPADRRPNATATRKAKADKYKWEYAMGEGKAEGFREIVMRNPGRYEISLMMDAIKEGYNVDPAVLLAKLSPLIPVLLHINLPTQEAMKQINFHMSLVTSTSGALEQNWHSDGEHIDMEKQMPCHALNVIIPLVNVTNAKGPTEIIPGSHFTTRQKAAKMKFDLRKLKEPVAPTLNYGDILMWDYRVLHRGKANISKKDRPLLVLTFQQLWFKDFKNWPPRSMTQVAAALKQ